MADPVNWVIEPLTKAHDCRAFACGVEALDDYIRKFAGQNQKTGVSQTFVATAAAGRETSGYYSIAAGAVSLLDIPEEKRKRLPRRPVPVAHLGRFAVDRNAQGKRLGEYLLIDAMRRIDLASQSIGVHAIEVVAINDAAREFYLKYGFTQLLDDRSHLYISMKTVKALKLS